MKPITPKTPASISPSNKTNWTIAEVLTSCGNLNPVNVWYIAIYPKNNALQEKPKTVIPVIAAGTVFYLNSGINTTRTTDCNIIATMGLYVLIGGNPGINKLIALILAAIAAT